jgi:hypothetical protein
VEAALKAEQQTLTLAAYRLDSWQNWIKTEYLIECEGGNDQIWAGTLRKIEAKGGRDKRQEAFLKVEGQYEARRQKLEGFKRDFRARKDDELRHRLEQGAPPPRRTQPPPPPEPLTQSRPPRTLGQRRGFGLPSPRATPRHRLREEQSGSFLQRQPALRTAEDEERPSPGIPHARELCECVTCSDWRTSQPTVDSTATAKRPASPTPASPPPPTFRRRVFTGSFYPRSVDDPFSGSAAPSRRSGFGRPRRQAEPPRSSPSRSSATLESCNI